MSDGFRTYGEAPYRIALLHGGPGAPGYLGEVARELSSAAGILEPFQSAGSISGQLDELDAILVQEAEFPLTLAGHSWGGWLGYMYAARFPDKVSGLVLIGSGPFEEKYVPAISEARNKRFTPGERSELVKLEQFMQVPVPMAQDLVIKRYLELMDKANSFDPVRTESALVDFQPDIYRNIWLEAAELRKNGKLLEMAGKIDCEVTVIHGYEDPHPWEGVVEPLKRIFPGLRFYGLQNCGHEPWNERHAREEFFRILKSEL